MDSPSLNHFPPVVFREGKKYLWNRLERKALVNRPEERVRLRFIDYLTLESGWPKSRISAETPVPASKKGHPLRTDLICYSAGFTPEILIECKAESIPVTLSAAEQIARYNRSVQAEWLCITNGLRDHWYHLTGKQPVKLDSPPMPSVSEPMSFRLHLSYWQERGFAGPDPSDELHSWLTSMLPRFWSDDYRWDSRFLDIPHALPDLPLSHYYRIIPLQDDRQIAVSFLRKPDGASCLGAILNENQKNRGILIVNLDQWFGDIEANSILYLPGREKTLNAANYIPADFHNPGPEFIRQLPVLLEAVFIE